MNRKILVTQSSLPSFEEYCDEIRKFWDSHWLTNMGAEHKQFQAELERYLNCPHAVLFTNGHLALENLIAAMRFPAGSEIITTPFTFVSTTHAIVRNGLVPVFCDINLQDYTIDTDKIEALITEKTAAILPVHVYGILCDTEKIQAIAEKHHLKVIYDAAHAFGVRQRGISAANFGNASMFSFHATKVFHTIEGGAVCTADEELVRTLNDMKNFGIRGPEKVEFVGGNAKMSEFQAAMGICNLHHLHEEISKRRAITERYRANLSGITGIRLCMPQKDTVANYAYFPVLFDGYRASRDEVYTALAEQDIFARKYFYPLTNSLDCYADLPSAGKEKTPAAAYAADRILTLPLYADLDTADVDRICGIILNL